MKLNSWAQASGTKQEWRFAFTNSQIALAAMEIFDADRTDYALEQEVPLRHVGEVARDYLEQYSPTSHGAQSAASAGQAPIVTLNKQQVSIVRNNVPSNDGVVVSVAGYAPGAQITMTIDALQHERYQQVVLQTDGQGQATYLWSPAANARTDMAFVVANGPFKNRNTWVCQSQPLQIAKEREFFLDSAETYPAVITYSDDVERFYPKDPIDGHQVTPEEFLDITIEAAHESYSTQVGQWGFDPPLDDNNEFEIALNSGPTILGGKDCEDAGGGWTTSFTEKALICFLTASWDQTKRPHNYSFYSAFIKAVFVHEFFHTLQRKYLLDRGSGDGLTYWRWYIEGQARFVESVQHETENFIDGERQFSKSANTYLTQELNTSLFDVDTAYDYALFWRFLYEQYGNWNMSFLKTILVNAQSGGTTASFTDGAQAIADALHHPFEEILAHFAAANHALRFQPRLTTDQFAGRYTYDSDNVYIAPPVTSWHVRMAIY